MFPHTTTDRFIMAERIQVGVLLCYVSDNVFRSIDFNHHSSDYHRAKETIT